MPLCLFCQEDLRSLYLDKNSICPHCAQFSKAGEICAKCRLYPPLLTRIWACAHYTAPLKQILHAWKYGQKVELGAILCEVLCQNPPPWLGEIDSVLAMPMSKMRRLQRGFNQCDELAHALTTCYDLTILPHDSVLRQHKPPQSTLDAMQREQNIRDVFHIHHNVKNRRIMIIDDVMTTGATLNELARTLLKSGARAVYACVVLRNL